MRFMRIVAVVLLMVSAAAAAKTLDMYVIDLLNTEGLTGFHDAVHFAAAASVDHHALAGGRNQQKRLPAFHIDDIHVERLGR